MKNKKLVNYVKNKKLLEYNFSSFQVFVKDELPKDVDVKKVFEKTFSSLPEHFLNLIDVAYIGDFSFFKEKNLNAMFIDGALYITNQQDNNSDMLDDVIHEISHAVEKKYSQEIYEDQKIKNEYFNKLKKLKNYLSFEGHDIRGIDFFNEEYNKDFDDLLFRAIGYEKLAGYIKNLFLSPYSVTSLREYFARGFEEYYIGNRLDLKDISPYVYSKIMLLSNINDYNGDKYEY